MTTTPKANASQENAWRFLIAERKRPVVRFDEKDQPVTEWVSFSWASESNFALVTLAIALINDTTGQWATSESIHKLTGISKGRISKALKMFREITDTHAEALQKVTYSPTLRYSKVGNRFKYQISPSATDAS
jgi:galactose-1-phosphate uridylyltransferase